ncbi:hypothetical protein ACF09J_18265 [Streptomyces sp. NPDC014889]|uniref:hypothetical protein n=1 Tax=Streptomyces sp. NPDC014889 TaxID=3364928 RepID=UPI0037018BC6
MKQSSGDEKQQTFDELRALLAVHETAEEMILRPVAADTAGTAEGSRWSVWRRPTRTRRPRVPRRHSG